LARLVRLYNNKGDPIVAKHMAVLNALVYILLVSLMVAELLQLMKNYDNYGKFESMYLP
jgi:hypothetical protein